MKLFTFLIIIFVNNISFAADLNSDKNLDKKIREIIIYKIKSDKADSFKTIKDLMLEESSHLKGLYSATTSKILDSENIYADTMIWESKQASLDATPIFNKLPTASKFLGMWDGPPLQHIIMEYEPDQYVEKK